MPIVILCQSQYPYLALDNTPFCVIRINKCFPCKTVSLRFYSNVGFWGQWVRESALVNDKH